MNTDVPLHDYATSTWAVLVAILASRPIGIGLGVSLSFAAGFRLPQRPSRQDGIVVGIGFTVALFFATARFRPGRW